MVALVALIGVDSLGFGLSPLVTVPLMRAKGGGNSTEMGDLGTRIDAQMMPRFDSITVHMEEIMGFHTVSL
jgi:hypothetical protein